jgi:YD repeat-containing protein
MHIRTDGRSVTTTYTYDALNRLTQASYSDGTTPTANYLYDTAVGWANPAITQTNLIGRLSEAYISGTSQGDEVFGYDVMGRVNVNNQCSPVNCGTGNMPVSYTYDLLGDMLNRLKSASNTGESGREPCKLRV